MIPVWLVGWSSGCQALTMNFFPSRAQRDCVVQLDGGIEGECKVPVGSVEMKC